MRCTPSQLMDLLGCSGGHTQGRHMCLELKPSRPVTSLHPVMHPAPHSPGSLPPLTQSKSGPNFILHPYEDTSISNLQSSTAASNTDTTSSTAFTEGTWRGALELEGGGLHGQRQHTLYLHGASACHTAFRQHNLQPSRRVTCGNLPSPFVVAAASLHVPVEPIQVRVGRPVFVGQLLCVWCSSRTFILPVKQTNLLLDCKCAFEVQLSGGSPSWHTCDSGAHKARK